MNIILSKFCSMNKTSILIGLAAIMMSFAACSKDLTNGKEDNYLVIETRLNAVNVENARSDIATVKAIITNMLCLEDESCRIEYEVASSKFKNGGFKLNFSATVPDKYLEPIFVDKGFTVSDIQAKIGVVGLDAFDSAGNRIGYFSVRSSDGGWLVDYVYADRNFTLKGKTEYDLAVDYSFNKGWNIIYYSVEGAHYYTTQKPLNVDFKCYFPEPRRCGTH